MKDESQNGRFHLLFIPVVFFFLVAVTVNFAPLLRFYSDYDLTPYLTAKSISNDFDLAYTRTDSDRFFREEGFRPSRFFVKIKQIVSSSSITRRYFVFYSPDLYTFALIPFVKLFSFYGVFLLNAFLISLIYLLGGLHYKSSGNSLLFYTIAGLPLLFMIPSHHLFLFAVVSTSIFLALRDFPALSAVALAVASGSQFWSILLAPAFLYHWEKSGKETAQKLRFIFSLLVSLLVIWGIEYAMYPGKTVSETRWVLDMPDIPLAGTWNQLPVANSRLFASPDLQRLPDLFFGRTVGIFVYGFAGCALFLAALWHWRGTFIRSAMFFLILLLCMVVFSDPLRWNFRLFAGDLLVLILAIAFFLLPLFSSRLLLLGVLLPSLCFVGPFLANPFGAVGDRYYYLQTFPYRYFPVELSLIGKLGRTAKPDYRLQSSRGTIYFLNDSFYHDSDFFWVRGESTLEFLIESNSSLETVSFKLQSGSVDDHVIIKIAQQQEEFHLGPNETAYLPLDKFKEEQRAFEGKYYLHGKIESKSGFAPRLLSRENPDYRYLGCQIHLINNLQGEITQ